MLSLFFTHLEGLKKDNGYLFEEKSVPQFIRFGGAITGADEEKVRQIMGLADER